MACPSFLRRKLTYGIGNKILAPSGGVVYPPTAGLRWYWNMTSPSYVLLNDAISVPYGDDFEHEFTCVMPNETTHLLAINSGNYRLFMSTASLRFGGNFGSSVASTLIQLTQSELNYITDGTAKRYRIGRANGLWHLYVNDSQFGTGSNNSREMYFNSFGTTWGGSSSLTGFYGVNYDHVISWVENSEDNEMTIPLDEAFSDDHLVYSSEGVPIGVKYNDMSGDYTQEEPS